MSTAAVSSAMTRSSLNPNAPLFIPAAVRQVEDFSPEWWELVKTTTWFRDHWFREHQEQETFDGEDEDEDEDDVVDLLPDSFDLGITDDEFDQEVFGQAEQEPAPKAKAGLESAAESLIRSLSLRSPKNGATKPVLEPAAKFREKPAQCVSPKFGPRRIIHQPR